MKDTGTGIDEDKINRIFERFYQVDGQRKGTGIGLSLVKMLVEKHHGTITVAREPAQYTEFKVTLPADITAFTEKERELPAHRIRGGPPDAVGVLRPGDKQGVDFKAAQDHVEFRLEERAETELAQDGFVRQRRELIDDLGALGAGDTDACSLGKQRRAPALHIAPIPAMLADHVDHAPAFRACAVEQFLDGGYGGLRALHAQRSFGKDEIVLHVDDDESNVHDGSLAAGGPTVSLLWILGEETHWDRKGISFYDRM